MNRTRCYPLWKRAYHIFLLACMFVISKDVPLHNYGRFFCCLVYFLQLTLCFVLSVIWPSILNVILRLCLLMYAVRTFCAVEEIFGNKALHVYFSRLYHLWFQHTIETHCGRSRHEELWEINATWNTSIHPKQYIWSRSYRWITFSNNFLASRFDFITINFLTKPCFRRWCLDDTLDF